MASFLDIFKRNFSLFSSDIGIDLGTATVLVYVKGKGIVLNEPSVVAVNKVTGKLVAVGTEAQETLGRTPDNIIAIRPLREGVISDYEMTELMIKEFIRKVQGFRLFKPNVVICVPSIITEVEERAVIDAGTQAGAKRVFLIEEPVAAAIGAGLDISRPNGNLVVDIGGGTTGTAVISNGKVIASVDDATGGHHVTLAMSGALSVPYEEAELKKRGTDNRQYAPIVKPVFERISDIVKAHISGHAVDTVYLTGGTCCFPGIAPLFEKELGIKVECPDYPLLLTPLAIACLPLMEG